MPSTQTYLKFQQAMHTQSDVPEPDLHWSQVSSDGSHCLSEKQHVQVRAGGMLLL